MTDAAAAEWLAVNWQDCSLTVWAMQGSSVLESATANIGAPRGTDSKEAFDAALKSLIASWQLPNLPVFIAGLPAGGWSSAAPRLVPCDATAPTATPYTTENFAFQVIPPLRQRAPSGLLQGAETRIAGFLSLNKDWDGVICLPGMTSVWAQVSAGEVVSFQTFLTGELTGLLGEVAPADDTALDDTAFDEALSDGLSRPERLAARLSSIRADLTLGEIPPPTAQARLAGTLIGAELAAARPYWLGQTLAVIGAGTEARLYLRALAQQGAPATEADGKRMALAGICAVRRAATGG
ncbi:putative 2-dehydro-3-deoxygalactonokinase DgoK1 [Sulfitobacter sp. DSM 110093]|uniref:2-dehydro-3-deoxygalactonokinase n=1 Tax=Sulfitobacter sp. DSM 110093 TaxID=2883127 RepID=UPI001FACE147|nr:2-dehydro-3-deoxygalactonokinase [Sulfitobacter sp. DSM 110093]UOA32141.1 putative 2-dehydro-3-deoxygalactonokinase DgoK1 [Sulfitobacter sp. DSM 110093]